jgi:hypothetical protein
LVRALAMEKVKVRELLEEGRRKTKRSVNE